MSNSSQVIDFQKYIVDRDVDSRIKSSRDDMLRIMRADIKALDAKVDGNFEVLISKIEVLDAKVDSNFEVLNSKIDTLAASTQAEFKVIDTKIERLDDRITQVISMRKWAVGMFVVILLAIAAPYIAALF